MDKKSMFALAEALYPWNSLTPWSKLPVEYKMGWYKTAYKILKEEEDFINWWNTSN